MNTIGNRYRFTTAGESHGPQITTIVDGVPPGIAFDQDRLGQWLARRRPGQTDLASSRTEADDPQVTAGVFRGFTTGAPIAVTVMNHDAASAAYDELEWIPRPGHADYPAHVHSKGYRDYRGGGIFSGRLTIGHIVAGAIAEQVLHTIRPGIGVHGEIIEIAGTKDPSQFPTVISQAKADQDSVGGVIEGQITGLPAGWGGPKYLPVEGLLAALIFTIPAVTGIEFGDGFEGARIRGSRHNDPYQIHDGHVSQVTNHCGGVLGGLTTGSPVVLRVAVKPTSSIGVTQASVNLKTKTNTTVAVRGRHDPCIALRALPVVEATLWAGVMDLVLLNLDPFSPPTKA